MEGGVTLPPLPADAIGPADASAALRPSPPASDPQRERGYDGARAAVATAGNLPGEADGFVSADSSALQYGVRRRSVGSAPARGSGTNAVQKKGCEEPSGYCLDILFAINDAGRAEEKGRWAVVSEESWTRTQMAQYALYHLDEEVLLPRMRAICGLHEPKGRRQIEKEALAALRSAALQCKSAAAAMRRFMEETANTVALEAAARAAVEEARRTEFYGLFASHVNGREDVLHRAACVRELRDDDALLRQRSGQTQTRVSALSPCEDGTAAAFHINAVSSAMEGRRLLCCSADTLFVWDPPSSPVPLQKFVFHDGYRLTAVAMSGDGAVIATCSTIALSLWSGETGHLLHVLDCVPAACLDFAPKGRALISASVDGTLSLWDVDTGICAGRRVVPDTTRVVRRVQHNADGSLFLTCNQRDCIVWDADGGADVATLRCAGGDDVLTAAFFPGGTRVAGVTSRAVLMWDTRDGGVGVVLVQPRPLGLRGIAVSPCGTHLAVVGEERHFEILRSSDGSEVCRPKVGRMIGSVAFCCGGESLACRAEDGCVTVWSTRTWKVVALLGNSAAGDVAAAAAAQYVCAAVVSHAAEKVATLQEVEAFKRDSIEREYAVNVWRSVTQAEELCRARLLILQDSLRSAIAMLYVVSRSMAGCIIPVRTVCVIQRWFRMLPRPLCGHRTSISRAYTNRSATFSPSGTYSDPASPQVGRTTRRRSLTEPVSLSGTTKGSMSLCSDDLVASPRGARTRPVLPPRAAATTEARQQIRSNLSRLQEKLLREESLGLHALPERCAALETEEACAREAEVLEDEVWQRGRLREAFLFTLIDELVIPARNTLASSVEPMLRDVLMQDEASQFDALLSRIRPQLLCVVRKQELQALEARCRLNVATAQLSEFAVHGHFCLRSTFVQGLFPLKAQLGAAMAGLRRLACLDAKRTQLVRREWQQRRRVATAAALWTLSVRETLCRRDARCAETGARAALLACGHQAVRRLAVDGARTAGLVELLVAAERSARYRAELARDELVLRTRAAAAAQQQRCAAALATRTPQALQLQRWTRAVLAGAEGGPARRAALRAAFGLLRERRRYAEERAAAAAALAGTRRMIDEEERLVVRDRVRRLSAWEGGEEMARVGVVGDEAWARGRLRDAFVHDRADLLHVERRMCRQHEEYWRVRIGDDAEEAHKALKAAAATGYVEARVRPLQRFYKKRHAKCIRARLAAARVEIATEGEVVGRLALLEEAAAAVATFAEGFGRAAVAVAAVAGLARLLAEAEASERRAAHAVPCAAAALRLLRVCEGSRRAALQAEAAACCAPFGAAPAAAAEIQARGEVAAACADAAAALRLFEGEGRGRALLGDARTAEALAAVGALAEEAVADAVREEGSARLGLQEACERALVAGDGWRAWDACAAECEGAAHALAAAVVQRAWRRRQRREQRRAATDGVGAAEEAARAELAAAEARTRAAAAAGLRCVCGAARGAAVIVGEELVGRSEFEAALRAADDNYREACRVLQMHRRCVSLTVSSATESPEPLGGNRTPELAEEEEDCYRDHVVCAEAQLRAALLEAGAAGAMRAALEGGAEVVARREVEEEEARACKELAELAVLFQ